MTIIKNLIKTTVEYSHYSSFYMIYFIKKPPEITRWVLDCIEDRQKNQGRLI